MRKWLFILLFLILPVLSYASMINEWWLWEEERKAGGKDHHFSWSTASDSGFTWYGSKSGAFSERISENASSG